MANNNTKKSGSLQDLVAEGSFLGDIWELLSKMGGGFAAQGISGLAGAAGSLIGGDTTILSALLPKEAQPLAALFAPLVKSLASAAYDSALGYDKTIHDVRPSAYVGNKTAELVEAKAFANRVYKAFRGDTSDKSLEKATDLVASGLYKLTERVSAESASVTEVWDKEHKKQLARYRKQLREAEATRTQQQAKWNKLRQDDLQSYYTELATQDKEFFDDYYGSEDGAIPLASDELARSAKEAQQRIIAREVDEPKKNEQYDRWIKKADDLSKAFTEGFKKERTDQLNKLAKETKRDEYFSLLAEYDEDFKTDYIAYSDSLYADTEGVNPDLGSHTPEDLKAFTKMEEQRIEAAAEAAKQRIINDDVKLAAITTNGVLERVGREDIANQQTEAKLQAAKDGKAPKWITQKALAGALLNTVEDEQESVVYDYHKLVTKPLGFTPDNVKEGGSRRKEYKIHADFLQETLNDTFVNNFLDAKYGYNTAADVASFASDAIRRNVQDMRRLDKLKPEQRKSLQQRVLQSIEQQASDADKMRAIFGKKASAEDIAKELKTMGLSVANMNRNTYSDIADTFQRLAVNAGVTKSDLTTMAAQSKLALQARGLDTDYYGAGVATQVAAIVGKETSTEGLSKSEYATDVANMMSYALSQGQATDEIVALDVIDQAEKAGLDPKKAQEFRSEILEGRKKFDSQQDVEKFANELKISKDDVASLYIETHLSANRVKATEALGAQLAKNVGASLLSSLQQRSTKKGAVTEDKLMKYLNAMRFNDSAKRRQLEIDMGLSTADMQQALHNTAIVYGTSEQAVREFVTNAENNRKDAAAKVSSKTQKYSTNAAEALAQVMKESGRSADSKVSFAKIAHAMIASSGWDADKDVNKKLANDEKFKEAVEEYLAVASSGDKKKLESAADKIYKIAAGAYKKSHPDAKKPDTAKPESAQSGITGSAKQDVNTGTEPGGKPIISGEKPGMRPDSPVNTPPRAEHSATVTPKINTKDLDDQVVALTTTLASLEAQLDLLDQTAARLAASFQELHRQEGKN